MEAHQVVPDLLDVAPPSVATVKYPSGVEMNMGLELTPTQVKDTPTVTWSDVDPAALYTVLFTDPDAPCRANPIYSEVLHWLVVNVPGQTADISSGVTIMDYAGSGPPDGTDLHRYLLTIYKQPGALPVNELKAAFPPTNRLRFNSRNFIAKYNLGVPVAGNFYQAKFDEHVREKRGLRLSTGFKDQQIVPDVVDKAPVLTIEVKYASGLIMNLGAELTSTQVKDIPEYLSWRVEPNALYTLCLTDPDAPSRADPKFREFVHWLVVNIKGQDISSGQTLVEYFPSSPGKDTGLHRYCLLLYEQSGVISPDFKPISSTIREERRSFRIREFASKYSLQGPVAGNYYLAQYQD